MVISERENVIYFQPFLKITNFLIDTRKDFLIISNFYLVEILSEPNSLTIVTSKKLLKMSNYVLILSFFFSNENQEFTVYSGSAFSGLLTDRMWGEAKILKTLKLGRVISYLRKIKKIYKSRDTPLEFCWRRYFSTKNWFFILKKCKYRLRFNF